MALTQIDDRGLKTPIDLLDNEKIRLGTGNDIELYHDGTDSFLSNSTGGLKVLGDTIRLKGKSVDENMVVASANGAVELYYDNSKKLETTSTGTTVTGNLNCTALLPTGNLELVDSNAGNVGRIRMGAGDDFVLYHDGSHSHLVNNTGELRVAGDTVKLMNGGESETYLYAVNNGAVELNYDNSKKFETTSSGVSVTGDGEVKALSATADNTDKKALFTTGHRDTSEENVSGVIVTGADGDNIVDIGGGHGSYNSATKVRFYTGANATTTTGTERMRINPTGTVIIGATSYGGGGATPALYVSSTSGRQAKIHNTNANTTSLQLTNASTGQGEDAGMMFATLGTSGDGWINNAENAAIRLGTNGTERLRILAGGGLTFNGDTAAANALDDYEEGTFTPQLAGFSSISYHRQDGFYTKIGRQVWMHVYLYVYQATGNSNKIRITNLPFTSSSANSGYIRHGGTLWYQNDTFKSSFNSESKPHIYIDQGSTEARFVSQAGSELNGEDTYLGGGANNRYIICGLQMIV